MISELLIAHSATTKLPAGKYWITDPGYAYPDAQWRDFCHAYSGGPSFMKANGFDYFVWGTAYGDGIYELKGPTPGLCGVDSGLLSIIPDALIKIWGAESEMKKYRKRGLVAWIKMTEEFEVKESDGNVKFGKYRIKTS